MSKALLLATVALPMLLAPAARSAEPRDLLDPTARSYDGQVLPAAEIDARRGWLAFSEIDNARDALARDRRDTAQHLIARAQASVAEFRRAGAPDPSAGAARARRPEDSGDVALPSARLEAQLAQAAAALRAGDPRGADRLLGEAGGALRTALVRYDDRQRPATTVASPSGRFTTPSGRGDAIPSYGSSGGQPGPRR